MSTDWIIPVVLGTLPLAGVVLVWWAWFGERRSKRKRPRCPKCWHDMGGLPEASALTCPECGATAPRVKHLHRKRRRHRVAIAGLLVLVLGPWLWTAYQKRSQGLAAFVPTTPLILVMGWTPDYDHPVQRLLRQLASELDDWQIALIYHLHVDIDPADLEEVVTVADVWFRGEPVPVHTDYSNLRNVGAFAHSFTITDEQGNTIGSGGSPYTPWTPTSMHISLLPNRYRSTLPTCQDDECTYRFDVLLNLRWSDYSFGPTRQTFARTLTHSFERTVRFVDRESPGATDQLFQQVHDPVIDRFVAQTFELQYGRNAYGGDRIFVRDIYEDDHEFDVTFAYDVEVYEGDDLLFRATHADNLIFDAPTNWHHGNFKALMERLKAPGSLTLRPDGLTLRIVPRLDLAAYAPEMHRVWAGSVDGPLREFLTVEEGGFKIAPAAE